MLIVRVCSQSRSLFSNIYISIDNIIESQPVDVPSTNNSNGSGNGNVNGNKSKLSASQVINIDLDIDVEVGSITEEENER